MLKIRRKLKDIFRDNKGYTLVELLVSFVILAILMTSALSVLTSASGIYARIKAANTAQNVSTILMDKIEGELDDAGIQSVSGLNNNTIKYENKDHLVVTMSSKDQGKNGNTLMGLSLVYAADESVPWKFSNNTYMGNEIERISFTTTARDVNDSNSNNRVTVTLTIRSTTTNYSYTRTKTIRCKTLPTQG